MNYDEHLTLDARLVILRALAEQKNKTLNETLLTATLDSFGHRRSREWVRTQLMILQDLGAINLAEGSIFVATVTRAGSNHLELRSEISGIASPSSAL